MCAYSAVLKGRVVEVALVNNRLCELSSFFFLKLRLLAVRAYMWQSEKNLWELVLFSYRLCSGDGMQVPLAWQQAPLLRNSLSGPALEP